MTNEAIEHRPGPNTVAAKDQPRTDLGRWSHGDEHRKLTELQVAYARAYAENGGNGAEAAISAGYSPASARSAVSHLMRQPWVLRAIEIERRRLLNRAGLLGLRVVIGIMEDGKEDKKLRLKAAEIALKADRADRDAGKDSGDGKRLNEMSIGELEALIRRLDQAAEQAALPLLEGSCEAVDEQPNERQST